MMPGACHKPVININTDFFCLIIHSVLFFSLLNLQIPNSQETADSPIDAIPKMNDRLIDWSQVSQMHVSTLLIVDISCQHSISVQCGYHILP